LNTIATAPFRFTPRLTTAAARWWAKPSRAILARSSWPSLGDLVANQPRGQEIHLIADNLSAHKTARVEQFLAAHPKVHLHYTPTYSSQLNQVENWFARIEREVIARGVFTSVKDWPASSCATSVTTTAIRNLSSGPTATPYTALVSIPIHSLQATSSPSRRHL